MGAGNFKILLQFSSDISETFRDDWLSMAKYRLLIVLAIGQALRRLWHFKILTCVSMGKS